MHVRTALAFIPSTALGLAFVTAIALGPACSSEDLSQNTGGTGGGGPVCNRDEVPNPGEICDDGNDDDTDGCTRVCRFTCEIDLDCTDSVYCNGKEKCNVESHTCLPSDTPVKDRTLCGFNQICETGVCTELPNVCGDLIVYEGTEECDDGDEVGDDGCESDCQFSCVSNIEERRCTGRDPCRGSWSCDDGTHQCLPGAQLPDGQACGANKACRGGVCADRSCGNKTREGAEECDDGNTIQQDGCENDCRFTCDANDPQRNCAIADVCAGQSTCDGTHQCTKPTPKPDITPCGGEGFECRDGACIDARVCGNGTLDPGENCDDQNTDDNDGCKKNCRFGCETPADCNDSDPCNGAERCEAVGEGAGRVCRSGAPPVKGTPCGTGKVCIDSSCGDSTCGDGYVDTSKNEQCEPPSTSNCSPSCQSTVTCDLDGTWAVRILTAVDWDGTEGIVPPGSGTITTWAKIERSVSGTTATDETVACGLQVPDFEANVPTIGYEQYRIEFPSSIFDNNSLPAVTAVATLSAAAPGATFKALDPIATVLGAAGIPDVENAGILPVNPDISPYLVDQDGDGSPGITAHVNATVDPDYRYIPVAGAPLTRADRVYLAVRQVSAFDGSIVDCTSISGAAFIGYQDSRIVGCRTFPESADAGAPRDCTPVEFQFADDVKVLYIPTAATFEMKKIANGGNCAAVRAALP